MKKINKLKKFLKNKLSLEKTGDFELKNFCGNIFYRLSYKDLEFKYTNNNISDLIGYSAEEMRFMDFFSLIELIDIKDKRIKNIHNFKSFRKIRESYTDHKWEADYLVKSKQGEKIWIKDVAYPWYDAQRNIIGSIGSLSKCPNKNLEKPSNENIPLKSLLVNDSNNMQTKEYLFEKLKEGVFYDKNDDEELSMLLIHVDQFDLIAQKYGVQAMNKTLPEMSNIIECSLKETDVIARISESEFIVFLPATSEKEAYWVAERICKTIENHDFYVSNHSNFVNCTVSIGISSVKSKLAIKIDQLFKIADARLHIARNTGKNQVSVDEIVAEHQSLY